MTTTITFLTCIVLLGILLIWTKKNLDAKSNEYESLLRSILSPICIVDENGKLINIINKKYVKESAFDVDDNKEFYLTSVIEHREDEERFLKNLSDVINQRESGYVNQDFIITDQLGTEYRALLHIVYYKKGLAYVFFNRVRLPKG